MVRLCNANFGIGSDTLLAADKECANTSQVGLIGDQHEVEHNTCVVFEFGGNARRLSNYRKFTVSLALGNLDSPLDVAHGIQISVQLAPIASPDNAPQASQFFRNRVEYAPVFPETPQSRFAFRAPGCTEQTLKNGAWVRLHRKRGVSVLPCQRGTVGTAITILALADQIVRLERELERGELRFLAEMPRRNLIHRDAHFEGRTHPGGLHGVRAREERRLRAGMVPVALVQDWFGLSIVHSAQN